MSYIRNYSHSESSAEARNHGTQKAPNQVSEVAASFFIVSMWSLYIYGHFLAVACRIFQQWYSCLAQAVHSKQCLHRSNNKRCKIFLIQNYSIVIATALLSAKVYLKMAFCIKNVYLTEIAIQFLLSSVSTQFLRLGILLIASKWLTMVHKFI